MSLGNTPEFERYQLRQGNGLVMRLLSWLFPPKLGKFRPLAVFRFGVTGEEHEEGWAGNVRVKKYRDGIDRYFKESS